MRSRNRSRTRILLTNRELDQLQSAVNETGANKSFLVVEAIQRGFCDFDPRNIQTRRTCRIDAWIPIEFKEKIKQLAEAHSVPQQSLLRYFLFNYLKKSVVASTQPVEEESTQ